MSRLLRTALATLVVAVVAPVAAQTNVSGTISANTTWDAAGSPYVVTNTVTVAAGVTLTVTADTEVRFESGRSLVVDGTLAATDALFTSNRASPGRNAWGRIRVNDGATATLTGSTVEFASTAVELHEGGTASLEDVTISTVQLGVQTLPAVATAARVYDVWATGGLSLTDVTITGAAATGYFDAPAPYTVSGTNSFVGNDFEAIFVYFAAHRGEWTVRAGPTLVWWIVTDAISDRLVVDPGAVLKKANNTRRVRELSAIGTPGAPITFTSYRDDAIGGDSDNTANAPFVGEAGQLEVVEEAVVQHAVFRYGTNGRLRLDGRAADDGLATATITDSEFADNTTGLYAARAELVAFEDNTFSGNTYPVRAGVGLRGEVDPALNDGVPDVVPLFFRETATADEGTRRDSVFNVGLPYVFRSAFGINQVGSGATVVVGPGVIIKSENFTGLDVLDGGTFVMAGTAADPAILTSVLDDSAGGDTNDDGNTTTPVEGAWYGVLFVSGATGSLSHADVRYATTGFSYRYNDFFYLRGGLSAFGADLTVTDSRITDARFGIVSVAGALSVTGTEFVNASRSPVAIGPTTDATFSGNVLTNPGFEALGLLPGPVLEDATIAPRTFAGFDNITYVLESDMTVREGATVTVDPGVVIKASGGWNVYVDGALALAGTAAEPIVLTERRDDSVGNPLDTNGDGNTSAPGVSWGGIYYRRTTDALASPMSNVRMRYAGNGVVLTEADLAITDVEISDGTFGLSIDQDTAPVVDGLTIRNMPASHEPLVLSLQSSPTLTDVAFVSTGSRGIGLVEDRSIPYVGTRTLTEDVTLAPRSIAGDPNVPYVIRGGFPIPTGRTLTIAPSTILKMARFTSVNVSGALVADAEGADPVVITAFADDSVGGDTNADGNDTSPFRRYWEHITFNASAIDGTTLLRNMEIRYGRHLHFQSSEGRFEGSVYEQMSEGLYVSGPVSPTIADNAFLNISTAPVIISPFATPLFSGNTVSNVPILGLGLLGGTFVSDFTLGPRTFAGFENITYVPTGAAYNVNPGATLTIPAGIVFKFPSVGTGITVTGALRTTGTADDPVVFTSIGDDRFGNPADTNQDGESAPGRSAGVLIALTDEIDDANTILDGLVLAHATTGVRITNAAPTIRNSRFEFMAGQGIDLAEVSDPTIQGNTFADFDAGAVPIQFSLASDFTASGNVIEGRTYRALGIRTETLVSDARLTRRSFAGRAGIPYYVRGNYRVGTSATLTVDPGVVVKFNRFNGIDISRGLIAEGGADPVDKIVFTSITDDFYGGDTNRDSTASAPFPSYWNGIGFANEAVDGLSRLDHVIVRYATNGVGAVSAGPTITNARLQNNRVGLLATGASNPTVTDSDIVGNTEWGVRNQGTFTVTATGNWWGADSGPTVADNPGGTGDKIFGAVTYAPFVGGGTVNPVLGDVSLNGVVQAFDAAEILGHLVSPSLSATQLAVADVSGNGEVMAMDAALVLQFVVGILDAFPAESDARVRPVPSAEGVRLELGAWAGAVGDTVRVPVTLSGAAVDVYALELAARATGATVVGLEPGAGAEGATAASGAQGETGTLVLAATEPFPGGGPVAHLVLRLDAASARLEVDRAVVNETTIEAHAVDAEGPPPDAFGLAVAGANPFRGATALRVDVPEPSAVRVEVVDALGRRVAVLVDGDLPAGSHAVRWNARSASPGVYFVRMTSATEASVVRLVVVR